MGPVPSGASGIKDFRLRRIGSPHAMPHTRNSGHPRRRSCRSRSTLHAKSTPAPYREARKHPTTKREAPYREAPYREAPYREAPYREAPYREAPYREAPYREAPYREAPYREAPYREAPLLAKPEAPDSEVPAPTALRVPVSAWTAATISVAARRPLSTAPFI